MEMAALCSCFESLGYVDVRTYIQSGNVLFTSEVPPTPAELAAAIRAHFSIMTTVVLRTQKELERAIANNPFSRADPAHLHVGFMAQKPPADKVAGVDQDRFLPERFSVVDSELYLCLPDGMGRAKLPSYLDRQLKVPTTVRNWNTVNKLLELMKQ